MERKLTKEEEILIELYRTADERGKETIMDVAKYEKDLSDAQEGL